MAIYGYARVSTDGQTLDNQLALLRDAGAQKIFKEKVSGSKSDRQELQKSINALDTGDILLVTKLDRLARSTRDLLNVLDAISKKGAQFKVLNDPMMDTTTPQGKLLVQVLAAIAEFERSLIISRTNEGRQRAMANGVKFGRRHKLNEHQRQEAIKLRDVGQSNIEIAKLFNVSYKTIERI